MRAAVLACVSLAGCGEVYADLDVRKAVTVEPAFEPAAVYSGTTTWLAVRARFEGELALIEEHDLTGEQAIKLAYDRLDFFPGACPTTPVSEAAAGATGTASARTADGSWLFCAAIEVGTFAETTVLPLRIVFWNGSERLSGTAELTVIATSAAADTTP